MKYFKKHNENPYVDENSESSQLRNKIVLMKKKIDSKKSPKKKVAKKSPKKVAKKSPKKSS